MLMVGAFWRPFFHAAASSLPQSVVVVGLHAYIRECVCVCFSFPSVHLCFVFWAVCMGVYVHVCARPYFMCVSSHLCTCIHIDTHVCRVVSAHSRSIHMYV